MEPLKPVEAQVVVIMGASRGIGRAAARGFAARGAQLVLSARDDAALEELSNELDHGGTTATVVPADVSDLSQVMHVAEQAATRYGRIDTWVNNAAVTVYGEFLDISPEEFRRVMDVNFFGQVNGCYAALPHLQMQDRGALICVGSVLSDRSVPLQSPYCASKHALKGFLESLRVELASEKSGVQVTLVKPSSVNTPLFDEAVTHLGKRPKPVAPVYDPEIVATTIVHCAEHRERDVVIGGGGKVMTALEAFAGPLLDRYQVMTTPKSQMTDEPKSSDAPNNLYRPLPSMRTERGSFAGRSFSVYTSARLAIDRAIESQLERRRRRSNGHGRRHTSGRDG